MKLKSVQFSQDHNAEFYKELKKRVNNYFKDNNITRFGNSSMVFKTICMIALYLVPYILLVTIIDSAWLALLLWALTGIGMAGIGMSVMHDGNHGAYSKHTGVNRFIGYFANFVGGSDLNWRIQHNVLHHTYTNVHEMDDDIDVGGLMRFSPNQERLPMHKYQHLYSWFLYGLLTVNWFFRKDYVQIMDYNKRGLLKTQNISFAKAFSIILISKILYAVMLLVIPMMFAPVAWYISLIGFFTMQFISGFVLSVIFQLAHVIPSSDFPVPDESGNIKADWAVNQLYNTSNFAPTAKVLSWYVGGLNYQVEHHLFPNICHIHYKNISKIVKQTALEYNLPYYSYASFFSALKDHSILLKKLGTQDVVAELKNHHH